MFHIPENCKQQSDPDPADCAPNRLANSSGIESTSRIALRVRKAVVARD